jgi:hypothetical protein
MFSFAAMAAEHAPAPATGKETQAELKPLVAQPAPGITIINGKKFFSLAGARRFTNSGPSALQVMHHPRSGSAASHRPSVLPPVQSPADSAVSTKVAPSASSATSTDVLSVFAPDDKSVPAISPDSAAITPIK